MGCDELRAIAGELACGVAGASDRERALAHLAHCGPCRRDVRALGEVADGLVNLAPAAQPPAGFESRVLAALSAPARRTRAGARGSLRRFPARWVVQGAAVLLLAMAIGLGGWAIGGGGRPAGAPAASAGSGDHLVSAVLRAGGQAVGQVVVSAGPDPWISMAVDTDLGASSVRCEIVDHGHVVTLGTFSVASGYGYWATAVPVDPRGITAARLVSVDGHVVARATLGGAAG